MNDRMIVLYYDRIDISKSKSNNSKECMTCHYWLFNHGFKFQGYICNGCHDLTILLLSINVIAFKTVKRDDYHCIVNDINKSEAIDFLENCGIKDRLYI